MTVRYRQICIIAVAIIITAVSRRYALYADEAEEYTVKLNVIRAFDYNLPVIADEDFYQILAEALRVINAGFLSGINLEFVDNGEVSIQDFFSSCDYRETEYYRSLAELRYDLQEPPDFSKSKYREALLEYLSLWDIELLRGFYPDKSIETYDDFYELLTETYTEKMEYLRDLAGAGGSPVITPGKDYHSRAGWTARMRSEKKYDIVITNALIAADIISRPNIRSILKDAKIGSEGFLSPELKPFSGMSLMVNIIEYYGGLEGISPKADIPRELKNRIIGVCSLAREFGHTFFRIPDVNDHPPGCLMNTGFHAVDDAEAYRKLSEALEPCAECHPWIEAKRRVIIGEYYDDLGEYDFAGTAYISALGRTPSNINGDYSDYRRHLLIRAREAYKKAGYSKGVDSCNRLLEK